MWRTHRQNSTSSRGFTLLEMLIAIAIFAMLGLAANAVLQAVLKNDTVTQDFSKKLRGLQQGFGVIGRDLSQMVPRTARLSDGSRAKPFFLAGDGVLDSLTQGLSFYRIGWLNPEGMLPRGSIQLVAYVQVEDKLERWFFPYPDPEIGAEPQKTVLMTGVISVSYSFFIKDTWQQQTNGMEMPKAIAIEIEQQGMGKIQRKFLLPEIANANLNPANDENSNGSQENGVKEGQGRP